MPFPSNLMPLLQYSLRYGVILSVAMSALFLLAAYLNPEIMIRGYPPDIKAHYGAVRPATKGQRLGLALAVGLVLLSTLAAAIVQLPQATGNEVTFMASTLCIFIVLFVFNLVDLVIIDWLIFNTLQPKFIILPGTAGMAGYRDYSFHFKKFLNGILILLLISPIIAGVVMIIERLSLS